ncbi:hypothetical protein Cni_G18644 [Canna indica]|uniref:WRC domain-containing protein n=1 Tax=Canna indica TaxID=4628 RepID=A0AAQ3QEJ1_9LILI|nr:hypothetical protein Cni_G18644 [Canna indica]
MRIRKCAARKLGPSLPPDCSALPAGVLPSQLPPSRKPEDSASAAAASTSGLICELNRSPWDDPTCLELLTSFHQEEEEEEDGGILGNSVKTEAEEARGILGSPIKYDSASISSFVDGRPSAKYTARPRKKKKKKDSITKTNGAAAQMETSSSCKKTDGKGWHCKRPAQLPHTLCHYHLAQLRSYSNNLSHAKIARPSKEGHVGGVSRKKKTGAAGAVSDFYYYYSGFGPWRGKRRSRGGDNGDLCSPRTAGSEDGTGDDDAPVAGEDEADSEDGNDSGEDDKMYRKRRRKRMKARSLKSLL